MLIYIHGGPESQSLPTFQGRMNYYLGRTRGRTGGSQRPGFQRIWEDVFTLDNGMKREDSVKDIERVPGLDRNATVARCRAVAVMGGSTAGT